MEGLKGDQANGSAQACTINDEAITTGVDTGGSEDGAHKSSPIVVGQSCLSR